MRRAPRPRTRITLAVRFFAACPRSPSSFLYILTYCGAARFLGLPVRYPQAHRTHSAMTAAVAPVPGNHPESAAMQQYTNRRDPCLCGYARKTMKRAFLNFLQTTTTTVTEGRNIV